MARVGVGVPVFNGGAMLRQSLECLRTQSFEDIEVLMGDNASTDDTGNICAEFAARDSRFVHIRRPENLGSLPNFADLRQRSTAPLFMWRAYDDLSSQNFVAELVDCFDRDPSLRLAVCDIHSKADDRDRARIFPYRPAASGPRVVGALHRMFFSHASWIYGLWHRETLAATQDRTFADYQHAWGWDHLCMLPVMLDGGVSGTGAAHFVQRIVRSGTTKAERKAKLPSTAEMAALRADFARYVDRVVYERDWNATEKLVMKGAMPFYVDRRGYSRFKLMRRRWRDARK
ncbi:MAG: glycosyltransferase family 2 protein [Pseudomonadota bacterium]